MNSLGYQVNRKLVPRIRPEEGETPGGSASKAASAPSGALQGPCARGRTSRNQVCCWDFIAEFTQRGGKLPVFNLMIDESTGECHCIHADRCLKAADVLRLLKEAIASNGPPA